mgnify:CR=1 FL=1
MKVICPKCQFENHADSLRVVCARCATIIEVRNDQGSGMDINGKRHSSKLPFSSSPGPQEGEPFNRPADAYATRIGDEFDDVLDIPTPAQSSYQTNYEPSPVFDDVFATPDYQGTEVFDYSTADGPSKGDSGFGSGRQRNTHDFGESPEPEFMGWPVLPENAIDDEDQGGGFAANRGGLLARIVMGAIVFGGLVFGAYYFLGDLISKRKDQAQTLIADSSKPADAAPAQATAPPPAAPQTAPAAQQEPVQSAPVEQPKPVAEQPKPVEQPKVVEPPKKQESAAAKPVDIPPMTGRAGHSQSTRPAPAVSVPNRGNLTLQVASFNDQSQANERAARLKSAGVEASVVRAEISGKGTWYRVQIGRFASREEAESFGKQLRTRGAVQEYIITTVGK